MRIVQGAAMLVVVAMVTACATTVLGAPREPQRVNAYGAAVKAFRDRANAYLAVHKKAAENVPQLKETDDPTKLTSREAALGEAEHGLTPHAIATRLVYLGAPESLQAAVAAGLCGLGTTFAGTAEGAAQLLQAALGTKAAPKAVTDLAHTARDIVADHRARKASIPGVGHPIHKPVDPRTPRLFAIAKENGFAGRYVELIQLVQQEAERASKKVLPLNVTGAMGAILCELDVDWRLARGVAVIGRAVGLVGHIAEELRNPIAREIWERLDDEGSLHARPE